MKIVVAEKISPQGMDLLKAEGWDVVTPEQYQQDTRAAVADADSLIVRSAVQVCPELLQHAPKLRVIGRAGVGVDNVDVEAATRRGIVVMNTPGANAVAVAELTMALMLSLARHLTRADQSTRAGKWEKKSLQGTELRGKMLGIVGLGRIGVEVSRRAKAFGMRVIASDPYVSPTLAEELKIKLCSLDELYAQSDYISMHVGLTPQTSGMLNAEAFRKMKRGVRLVNCARGELVDEAALADALRSGQVSGAALDVFVNEPPLASPLLSLPNLVLTPHLGASTSEAQDAVGVQIASQVREYLLRGVVQNAVNTPSLTDLEYEQMAPYLTLARRLGSFLGQLFDSHLEEIRLRYDGALQQWKTDLIRNSLIAGVLQPGSQELINAVNAHAAAEERGIRLSERKEEERRLKRNAIHVALHGAATLTASGTVVHGESPRITELNGIDIELPLAGHLVVIANQDRPGVVGAIGTILGTHGINIARLSLGRAAANGEAELQSKGLRQALAVVQTDSVVPPEVVDKLRGIAGVLMVRRTSV